MRTLKDLVRAGSLVVAGLALGVSPAWSADVWLDARPLVGAENPAGIPQAVPMWGYASCDPNWTTCVPASVPGPQLVVPDNESSLTVHLRNSLPVPTSIVIPAQREDGMGAANSPSNGSGARMRAFTREASAGGTESYTWSNLTPGTYLYHSGSHVQVQVPMGLYGGLKHDDGAGRAYPGVNYDYETMLLFSEVDPILNAAVANGSYGTVPAPTSAIGYRPQYFLINGAVYVPTTPPIQVGLPNERKLLRFLNAGLRSHVPTLQNGFFHLKAEDGHLLPHGGHEQYSAVLPAGKTIDAMWIPTLNETYALYDGRLNDSMLVKMAVGVPRPATQPDAYATPENQTLNVPAPGVLANDGAGPFTAQLVNNVTVGTLTLNPDGSFVYIPQSGFNGTATFQYRAVDGAVLGYMATVTITVGPVNDPPVANNDTATVKSGAPIQILVLANDTDIDDPASALRVASVTIPSNGTATIAPNELSVTYTSALGFSGEATFNYVARDAAGALSAPATVTVTVLPNAPPVAVDDSVTVGEDSGPIVISVLANDSDPDVGDTLSVSSVSTPTGGGGTATTNGQTVTYTPALNFSGTTSFTYQVSDGFVTSQGTVTVTVTPVSDPPVAVNDVIQVTRHGTFIAPAPGVLANDSDPDSPTLTASLVTGLNLGKGTLILASDGTVTYTPPVEFFGNQTFTYQASDGALTSAPATARLAKLMTVKKAIFTDRAGTAQDKWVMEGKASTFAGTSVTIYNGPTPGGTVIAVVPVVNQGWKYESTGNPVSLDASNMISIQGSLGAILTHVLVTRN